MGVNSRQVIVAQVHEVSAGHVSLLRLLYMLTAMTSAFTTRYRHSKSTSVPRITDARHVTRVRSRGSVQSAAVYVLPGCEESGPLITALQSASCVPSIRRQATPLSPTSPRCWWPFAVTASRTLMTHSLPISYLSNLTTATPRISEG